MSAEEFSGVEFSIEPVRGVRSFAVDSLGRLTGVTYKDVWKPGENVAACHKTDQYDYPAMLASLATIRMSLYNGYTVPATKQGWVDSLLHPKPARVEVEPEDPTPAPEPPHSITECWCGFYGYFDGSNDYRTDARVGAVIEGYGETVLGTRGFRSQKARIVALCVTPTERLAAAVCRNYADIPQFEDFAAMVTTYPPDLARVPGPETDPDFWTRVAP